MENLITLLLHLVQKVPYLSEADRESEMDLLRSVESHLGVSGVVPPATGATNAPTTPAPPVPVPVPVAEPAPADSPEAQAAPVTADTAAAASGSTVPAAETNAFSGMVADLSPEQRSQLEAALSAEGAPSAGT